MRAARLLGIATALLGVSACSDVKEEVSTAGPSSGFTDTTPPAAPSIANPSSNPHTSGDTNLVLSGGCEVGATVSLSGDATDTVDCPAGSYSFTLTESTDGTYNYTLTQTDTAGNTSAETAFEWTRDTSLPATPTVSAPAGNPHYSNTSPLTVSGGCTDPNTVSLSGDASDSTTCSGSAYGFSVPAASGEGTYSFDIVQNDGASDSAAVTQVWVYDTTAPDAPAITSPASNPYASAESSFVLSGTCESDATVHLSGAETDSTACSSGTYSFTLTQNSDGTYHYGLSQTDLAGNTSGATAFEWTRDASAPPAPTVTTPGSSPFHSNSSPLTISGGCETEATVHLSGDATDSTTCTAGGFSFTVPKGTDGTYDFTIHQNDGVNDSGTTAQQWVFDTAAPDVSIDSAPSDPNGGDATFTFSSPDGSASFECELDAGGYSACTSPRTYSGLADGGHSFNVRARDPAGNAGSPASHSWNQSAPVSITSSVMPADGVYGAGGEIIFQFTWEEAVTVTGAPRLPITLGSAQEYAVYDSGGGTDTLSFTYAVQAGDADGDGISAGTLIDLDGGSMEGVSASAGLDVSGFLGDLSQVRVDTSTTPPDQVTNVTSAPTTSSTELSVSWNVPNDNGTAITDYVLQYREKGLSQWNTRSPNPTSNSATVAGLSTGVIYEIRVAASNGVLGAYSAIHEASIFDIMSYSPIAWLDATDLNGDGSSVADGTLVGTWVDKTGAADNATESDPARQPVYATNMQNGLPAVRFDDLDRGLEGGFTRGNGTTLTIFVLGQYDSGYSDKCMFEFIGPGNARAFFIDRRYAGNTTYSPALTQGGFHLWRIENSGDYSTITEDGTTVIYDNTNDFNTDFTGNGTYYLGDDSTGGNRMYGYIGEILIFDSNLSVADIAEIEEYLLTKWGI